MFVEYQGAGIIDEKRTNEGVEDKMTDDGKKRRPVKLDFVLFPSPSGEGAEGG